MLLRLRSASLVYATFVCYIWSLYNQQCLPWLAGIRFPHTCLRKLYVLSSRGVQDQDTDDCLLEVTSAESGCV